MAHTSSLTSNFFAKQLSLLWVLAGAAVLIFAAIFSWWQGTSLDPQRVFWGMIEQNLSTNAVTLSNEQLSNNNGATAQETVQLDFGVSKQALVLTTLAQNGVAVRTETLQTPSHSYTRYVSINAEKSLNTKNLLNVWADTTSAQDTSADAHVPAAFPQVLLAAPMPMGNLSASQRGTLMHEIRQDNVYVTPFAKVKRQHQGGRLQYVFTVTVEPATYIHIMQLYADDMGMHEMDSLDPEAYNSQTPTTLQWTVDARSRRLVSIANASGRQTEQFTAYDVPITTQRPNHPLSAADLQARLTKAFQ